MSDHFLKGASGARDGVGALAPAAWAPKALAAREAFALGQELLANTPVAVSMVYEASWPERFSDFGEARAVWMAPASALWRASDQNQWRSLCCQALELDEPALRGALKRALAPTWGAGSPGARALDAAASPAALRGRRFYSSRDSAGFGLWMELVFRRDGPMAEALSREGAQAPLLRAARLFESWMGAGEAFAHPVSLGGLEEGGLRGRAAALCGALWEAAALDGALAAGAVDAGARGRRARM